MRGVHFIHLQSSPESLWVIFSAKHTLLHTITEKTRAEKPSINNPKCPENQQSTASPPCSDLGYSLEKLLAQCLCLVLHPF